MLTAALAHAGSPVAPHDLWRAWSFATPALVGLVVAAVVYHRGTVSGSPSRGRRSAFWAGIAALGIALVSPLDAMASALASAHMVQHVVLMLVAAPLLALSAPGAALLRGLPLVVRRSVARGRRWAVVRHVSVGALRHPVVVWLLHAGTLWSWHASALYDAAIQHEPLHVVEHGLFLGTGIAFWRVVVHVRAADRVSYGSGIALVFTMALQSVFLSALLTFARAPWYSAYAETTRPWGLDPLADQQLAGVIMWVPAGLVYVVAGLLLLGAWLRASDDDPSLESERVPV